MAELVTDFWGCLWLGFKCAITISAIAYWLFYGPFGLPFGL